MHIINKLKFEAVHRFSPSWQKLDKTHGFYLWVNGFVPKKIEDVSIEKMYFQRKIIFDAVLGDIKDRDSYWSIPRGPLCEILKMYLESNKDMVGKRFKETRFFKMFDFFNDIKTNWDASRPNKFYRVKVTKEKAWGKFLKLLKIYDNLSKRPYLMPPYDKSYIIVLEKPYRFFKYGEGPDIDGYEVWSGHNRVSALYMLGHKKARVVVAAPRGK